jgi:8-oxo-dGTP pyrophosphatase MutT (NUDIX family)
VIKLGRPLVPERFSCRIYGVLRRGEDVLLARSRFGNIEFVNFPGGGVELGEAPIEALKREYREETGIEIEPVRVLYASESAHPSPVTPIQIVGIYWLVKGSDWEPKVVSGQTEVLELFWAPLSRIPTKEMFPADLEFARRLPSLLD